MILTKQGSGQHYFNQKEKGWSGAEFVRRGFYGYTALNYDINAPYLA